MCAVCSTSIRLYFFHQKSKVHSPLIFCVILIHVFRHGNICCALWKWVLRSGASLTHWNRKEGTCVVQRRDRSNWSIYLFTMIITLPKIAGSMPVRSCQLLIHHHICYSLFVPVSSPLPKSTEMKRNVLCLNRKSGVWVRTSTITRIDNLLFPKTATIRLDEFQLAFMWIWHKPQTQAHLNRAYRQTRAL